MKRKITKVEFDALNEVLKCEYEEKNGSYFAKLEDDDEAFCVKVVGIRKVYSSECAGI